MIINAEAPVALGAQKFDSGAVLIMPLTTCCCASAKGCDGYVGCRRCYREIDPSFGDCWTPDEERGWDTYRDLLEDQGVTTDRIEEVVAEAQRQIAQLVTTPK